MGTACYIEKKSKNQPITDIIEKYFEIEEKKEEKIEYKIENKIEDIKNDDKKTQNEEKKEEKMEDKKEAPKKQEIIAEIIWIDPNIENLENTYYINELTYIYKAKIKTFKNVESSITYMKQIKFEEIKIIISSSNYSDLVKAFKQNINNMYIAPKIIVFTSTSSHYYENNKEYFNIDNFYKYGGITTKFKDVKKFLIDEPKFIIEEINIIQNYNKKPNEVQLTFEYIDCREKLLLPLFFKTLLSDINKDNLNNYTNTLYNTYSINNKIIKKLFNSIISMKNIPIEILSKYYARLYTIESDFYRNLNRDLGLNRMNNYLPYIQVLYEGVKFKSLPLASDKILYRGSKISTNEITKIKDYLQNKKPFLPGAIVFSLSFLSFSKERKQAENFFMVRIILMDWKKFYIY